MPDAFGVITAKGVSGWPAAIATAGRPEARASGHDMFARTSVTDRRQRPSLGRETAQRAPPPRSREPQRDLPMASRASAAQGALPPRPGAGS